MAEIREHNLAYDYNIYEEAEQSEAMHESGAEDKMPVPAHRYKTASVIRVLAVCIAVFGVCCYMIYGKVELTGLYSQQTKLENELARLTDENVSLESELAQKTGLTKVENYAENRLGLKKLDKSQIEFIEVPKRQITEAAPVDEGNLFVKLKNWFNGVLEYIGAK
jgi:hypothetical protein